MQITPDSKTIQAAANDIHLLRVALSEVMLGQPVAVETIVRGVVIDRHILLESTPGEAKTTAAKALAIILGGSSSRVQCTADLLPSDFTGSLVLDFESNKLVFEPGAMFHNVVVLDEVPRCSPKALSAALEAMEEKQVTVGGVSHLLPKPFLVIATRNPREHAGYYDLPAALLDRLGASDNFSYPDREAGMRVLNDEQKPVSEVKAVFDSGIERVAELQVINRAVAKNAPEEVKEFILDLAVATRQCGLFDQAMSTRSTIALRDAAASDALSNGNGIVETANVANVAQSMLAHRLLLKDVTMDINEVIDDLVAGCLGAS